MLKKEKICFDARMIYNSGIGTYIQNLIPSLTDKFQIILLGNKKELGEVFFNLKNIEIVDVKYEIYSINEQLQIPSKIPKCDFFWSPHYNIPLFPIKANKRIVTIHDVFHFAFYDQLSLSQKIYAKIMINAAVKMSDLILTVSEFSKTELIKYTGINPDKIKVVYNGLDNSFISNNTLNSKKNLDKFKITKPYILFVGNIKPHKNLGTLVSAYNNSTFKNSFNLVLVGKKDGFITGDENLVTEINGNNDIILTGSVSQDELKLLYQNAFIFVFPSLYEGFGLPPLEAMASGCPVICSNAASLPEVCGDAALYFDPLNKEALVGLIDLCITNKNKRDLLIAKGFDQIKKFSWDKHSLQVVSLIETL